MLRSTLAISSATLVALAAAEPIVVGDGASDISSEGWTSVVEAANLTSPGQTFTGRDVSQPYSNEAQEDWEFRLSVKDDVEIPDSDELMTASVITMSPPEGEEDVEIDDSWRVCAHVFPVKASSAQGWGTLYEPDCGMMVAGECVDDIRKNAVKKFGAGCPAYDITPSCLRDLVEEKGHSAVISSDMLNGTSGFFRSADGPHAADEEGYTPYADALDKPYLVVGVFGASGDSDEDAHAQVRCVYPETAEENSVDPGAEEEAEEDAEDAAPGSFKFVGWTALTGAAGAAVAMQLL